MTIPFLIPDLLIVCGKIDKKFLDFPPALIVEILSPSTALKDRNTKYQLYEQEKVKYYIIVDTDKECIEIYCLDNGKYSQQPFDQQFTFELQENCSISVPLINIFARSL